MRRWRSPCFRSRSSASATSAGITRGCSRRMPGATLVGAVDLVPERAQAAAEARARGRLTDCQRCSLGRVDAVTIAVPTVDSSQVARPFLERGVARAGREADGRVARGGRRDDRAGRAQSGAILAVGHTERFNPAMQRRCRSWRRPRFIEVHRLSGFPERSLDIDVVFDVMIHDLDIILAMDRLRGRRRRSDRRAGADAEEWTSPTRGCKFASGCIANITASRISRDKVRKVRFFQPDDVRLGGLAAQELEVWRLKPRPGERPAIEGGQSTFSATSRSGSSSRISSRRFAPPRAARDRRGRPPRAGARRARRRGHRRNDVQRYLRLYCRARATQGPRAHRRCGRSAPILISPR